MLWELVNKQPAGVSAWEPPGNIGHFYWQWRCGHFHSVGGANAAAGSKSSHSHSCRSLEGTRTPDRQPPQETENQVGGASTAPPTLHAWNSASSWCFAGSVNASQLCVFRRRQKMLMESVLNVEIFLHSTKIFKNIFSYLPFFTANKNLN